VRELPRKAKRNERSKKRVLSPTQDKNFSRGSLEKSLEKALEKALEKRATPHRWCKDDEKKRKKKRREDEKKDDKYVMGCIPTHTRMGTIPNTLIAPPLKHTTHGWSHMGGTPLAL